MLSRLVQFFTGKSVAPAVEDELLEQQHDLARIRREISEVEEQLASGNACVLQLTEREAKLREDIECVLMEIHDPMLIREQDGGATGDAHTCWEHTVFALRDPDASIRRISAHVSADVEPQQLTPEDDGGSVQKSHMANTPTRKTKRRRRLDFVVLSEHSDVDDEASSSCDEAQEEHAVVDVTRRSLPSASGPALETETAPTRVFKLQNLVDADFVSLAEAKRWRGRLLRMQQEQLVQTHFRDRVLREVVERRESIESKIFARQCDLIHLKAFEAQAERQLTDSGVLLGKPQEENRCPVVVSAPVLDVTVSV